MFGVARLIPLAIAGSLCSLALACGSAPPKGNTARGMNAKQRVHGTKSPHGDKAETVGVEAAELPYVVYDRAGGRVERDALFSALADAKAICVGETHSNPHHHWVQLQVLDQVSTRAASAGVTVAVGLEMFQRPFQKVLDDYAAAAIDERVMLARTEWRDRWGYDFALYRPMLAMAQARKLPILALNLRKEITKKVGKQGIAGLTDEERAGLPEVVLDDAAHRAWFNEIMSGHPGGEVKESVYEAQVLWDETMADTAARWVVGGDGRKVVIFAGNGHCHDSAIVRRMSRRGVDSVVSVRPVIDDGNGSADEALREQVNDYVIVMTMPE